MISSRARAGEPGMLSPAPAVTQVTGPAGTMWQRPGYKDVPVNNLLVRSRPARSACHHMLVSQRPGIIRSRLSLAGWPRFLRHSHDREDFIVCLD